MTKEKAEKILPVIQAIISGQKIQVNINNRWEDADENHNCAFLPESYEYLKNFGYSIKNLYKRIPGIYIVWY